jgi:hypothetical protein
MRYGTCLGHVFAAQGIVDTGREIRREVSKAVENDLKFFVARYMHSKVLGRTIAEISSELAMYKHAYTLEHSGLGVAIINDIIQGKHSGHFGCVIAACGV